MPIKPTHRVHLFYEVPVTLTNRSKLKLFIQNMFRNEEKELESLNYIFTSDTKVLEINKQYLSHDFYTDIITFELSESKQPTVGEIYISVDRVRDNANELGVATSQELTRVIFHGVLHLCGYKDKTAKEKALMRQSEDHYLEKFYKRST